MDITQGKLSIKIVGSPGGQLMIQAVPAKLTVNREANIAPVKVIGRNTYEYHYSGGEQHLEFELDFFANQMDRADVIAKCRWLESLTYTNAGASAPPKVKLFFGSLFKNEQWCVRKVSYDLSLFAKTIYTGTSAKGTRMMAEAGYLPQQAYVKIYLSRDESNNLSTAQVRGRVTGINGII